MCKKIIFVIILNFNNDSDSIECIKSLALISDYDLQIVVVDNNSINPSPLEQFVSTLSNAVFIQTGENRGYAAGNNLGIKYAIKNGAEYICILNNDVIVNKGSFSESIKLLDSDPKVAFAGPSILDYKSDFIQSQGEIINFWNINCRSKTLNQGKPFVARNGFNECQSINGACILFKSSIIEKIGYIPEEYFLYLEETDWHLRANVVGYKSCCSLSSYVKHKGSASVNCYNNLNFYYYNRNSIILLVNRDPLKIRAYFAILLLFVKAIVKTLIGYKGKQTNKYLLLCYVDGLLRTTRFKDFICSRGLKKKK